MAFDAFTGCTALAACLTVFLSTSAGSADAYPQQFQQQQQQQQQAGQPRYEPVSEVCLGCICESISSCNRTLTCEGDVCGMFRITWAYWADSGKPVLVGDSPSDALAYARCTNDPSCARQSVLNYLNRFAQDCNRDGVIDCLDYASIHKSGGYGCSAPLDWTYKNKYDSCQRAVYELSGSSATDPNSNIIFPTRRPQVGAYVPQQSDEKPTDEAANAEILDPVHIRVG